MLELPDEASQDIKEALELVANGVTPSDALAAVKGSRPSASQVFKFRQQIAEYALTIPKLQKMAQQAIEDTLAMRTVNGTAPSVAHRLAAARMVADRADPIVARNENINVNIDFNPVDLTKYRKETGSVD